MNYCQSLEQVKDQDAVQLLTEAQSLLTRGKLDKSESLCRLALDKDRRNPDAISLLGLVAHQTGHKDQAKQLLFRATETAPQVAIHHFRLGNIYFDKGNLDEAIASYRRALQLDPNYFAVLVNLGNTLLSKKHFDEAVDVSLKVLDKSPRCSEALSNLGQAYIKLGCFSKAYSALTKTVDYSPRNYMFRNNFGVLQQLIGDVDGAIESFQMALGLGQNCRLAERNLKIAVLNSPKWKMSDLFDLHKTLGHRHQQICNIQFSFPDHDFSPDRKLRIGYITSDFCEHPVGKNLLPLIKNHDHSSFQIHLYSCVERPDKLTQEYVNLADQWRDIGSLEDHKIAKVIIDDQIDIMVFLAGRFNLNRPEVAAHRPAPVQISFHDGATSGLKAMDYWLTDADLHPKEAEEQFVEALYRLPQFYQFTRPEHLPKITPPPVLHKGYVTFGSFNKPEKLSEEVVALWSRLLLEVTGSRLLLKYHNFFTDQGMKEFWKARFKKYGLDTDRLIFLTQDSGQIDHLKLYSQIDIALDPFPFNGVTTTFEALLMGVPVIALEGRRFGDRVAYTLLKQTSLNEFVAHSHESYVSIATALANRPQQLSNYRGEIRETLLNSSLFDGQNYARNMEEAYRNIWRQRCDSQT